MLPLEFETAEGCNSGQLCKANVKSTKYDLQKIDFQIKVLMLKSDEEDVKCCYENGDDREKGLHMFSDKKCNHPVL